MEQQQQQHGVHTIGQTFASGPTTTETPDPHQLATRLDRIARAAEERKRHNGVVLIDYGVGGIERPIEQMTLTIDDLRLAADLLRKGHEL